MCSSDLTAFPMLARIIQHRNLGATSMGVVSLGAGALNDAVAWCLLTLVLASRDGAVWRVALAAGGGIAFVAVATRGSLTAAAKAEGVAPAIMGRRLDSLEAHLGVKLLVRTTRRIALTREGASFLADCQIGRAHV